jgi:hypothetical protein
MFNYRKQYIFYPVGHAHLERHIKSNPPTRSGAAICVSSQKIIIKTAKGPAALTPLNLISNIPVNPEQNPAPPSAVNAANTPAWKWEGLGIRQARNRAIRRPPAPQRNAILLLQCELRAAVAPLGIGRDLPEFVRVKTPPSRLHQGSHYHSVGHTALSSAGSRGLPSAAPSRGPRHSNRGLQCTYPLPDSQVTVGAAHQYL